MISQKLEPQFDIQQWGEAHRFGVDVHGVQLVDGHLDKAGVFDVGRVKEVQY